MHGMIWIMHQKVKAVCFLNEWCVLLQIPIVVQWELVDIDYVSHVCVVFSVAVGPDN